jgi:hypothetical protein
LNLKSRLLYKYQDKIDKTSISTDEIEVVLQKGGREGGRKENWFHLKSKPKDNNYAFVAHRMFDRSIEACFQAHNHARSNPYRTSKKF